MYRLILIPIILFNFFSIFAQDLAQDYKIVRRSRDGKYALLHGDNVIIPYQKGRMFFLRGQGREVLDLSSRDSYYYLDEDSFPDDLVVVYDEENRLAAIYNLLGYQISEYCYDFKYKAESHLSFNTAISDNEIYDINKHMSKYGFTYVYYYGYAGVFPPGKLPYTVECNGSKGFISYEGELLFPPVYDHLFFNFDEEVDSDKFLIWFIREGIIGIRDLWGEELITFPDIDDVEDIYTGGALPKLNKKTELILLTTTKKKNKTKYGLLKIDLTTYATKWLLQNEFDEITNLKKNRDGIFLKTIKNGKILLFNSKLEAINGLKVDGIEEFNRKDNYFIIKSNGKLGIIDDEGSIILKPEFDKFDDRPNVDYIILEKKNKYGIFHLRTRKSTELKYDVASFDYLMDRFGSPNGTSITIKIFGGTDYENDKIGKITKNLEEVWSNWKEADINLEN